MNSHKFLALVACLIALGCARRQDASIQPRQFISVDPTTVAWRELPLPTKESLYRKTLLADAQTGTGVDLLRYPAGVVTPVHTHPHGHGMYVLEGTLVTNHGSFAPGMFVWFPEGEAIYHGAAADHDTVVLFIRHEPFEISFVDSPAASTRGAQ
jgi:quercetin dioxygenase-like cupin family protein